MDQAESGMIDYLDELLRSLEEPEEGGAVPEMREAFVPTVGGAAAADGREEAPAVSGRDGLAETARRAGGPGDLLAKALEQLEPVGPVSGPERAPAQGTDSLKREQSPVSGSILTALGRRAETGGSTAALERRLAAGAALQGTVMRPIGGFAAEELAGIGLELEELDRRVERDARRYDGGLFLY